jgi:ubiquinone/menaquinone biosynthesis C-methylase UbiE
MYDKEYLEYLKNRTSFQIWIRNFFFAPLRPYLTGVVLDIGCGIGELANHIDEHAKYLGVDINPYCVDYVKEKGLWAKQGSAYEIPLTDSSVDVVVMSHVLEHLEEPHKALKEISRVLQHNGIVIIIVPMIKGFHRDPTHRTFYDKSKLNKLAVEYYFYPISLTSFPLGLELLGKYFYFFEYRLIAQKRAAGIT